MNRTLGTYAEPTSDSSLQRDAEMLQSAVSDLVRLYQFRDRNRICCYDISVTQCYALEALVDHGPLRLSALAERLYLDKSTTSRVVQTLVRKRYATHTPESDDRRAVALVATRAGRRLYERITADLVEQQKLIVQHLDATVRAGVIDVIRRLSQAAEARFVCGVRVGRADAAPSGACCESKASKA